MTDEEMTLRFRKAVDLEKQLKIARGEPIARFDKATGKVFLEYPDGDANMSKSLKSLYSLGQMVPEKALLPDLLKSSILISMPMISSAAHIAPT